MLSVFNKLKETDRKEFIEKFSDIVTTRIEKRNPDNIL